MSKTVCRNTPYGGFDIPGLEGWLAALAGLVDHPEPVGAGELAKAFSWEKVRKEDVFVPETLLKA